ncbi:MAG: methylated-DNA--[protein]-cysteine S-methyltransferase [Chloroflexi bacterium]|nr:methylated-DNA--[protein]-cysteine S-methyltransferase [Chloroflexota bacterium]
MTTPLKFHLCETDAGWVGLVVSPRGLRATTLPRPSRDEALREVLELGAAEPASEAEAGDLPRQVRDLAAGRQADLAIDWDGVSGFRRAVLEEAMRIPAGETRSYGWLAAKVGSLRGARAVGRVMATNPLPLVVPCHRVVASDGSLHGYGGGLEMKAALLRAEGARR